MVQHVRRAGLCYIASEVFWKKPHKTNRELTPKRALKSRHIWWDMVLEREWSKTVD